MKKTFNSIQTKLSILTLVGLLLSTGVIGGLGLYYTTSATDRNTANTMNAACQQEAARLNNLFLRVEQSVNIMAYKALDRYNVLEVLQDKEEGKHYLEEMETVLMGALGSTQGAVATYLRFTPEFTRAEDNLFLVKNETVEDRRNGSKVSYSKHYIGTMMALEWYDRPVEAGEPVWLEPYEDGKINAQVISYTTPLYQEGQLIGVVGMDILFDDIITEVNSIKIYESGYGYIINRDNEIIHHPHGEDSFSISRKHEEWDTYVAMLGEKQEKDFIFQYGYNGEDKKMTYSELENGMLLIVTAPVKETDLQKQQLVSAMVVAAIVISTVCCFAIILYTKTIILPLKELTRAAKEVAKGNMEVSLMNNTNDEVGELAASFQQTVDCLRIYMERMNDLAYRDPLTGVKSKAAYDEKVKEINTKISLGFTQFGVLMLDINGLKNVNDQYGHEAGNSYIINCCKLICAIFKHSPVFRIGGDEFIAILMGEDLLNIDLLLEKFYDRMKKQSQRATCPEENVSVAAGYAVFKEAIDHRYEDVFVKADEEMYKKKSTMKGRGRE